jgi:hypothetical protein
MRDAAGLAAPHAFFPHRPLADPHLVSATRATPPGTGDDDVTSRDVELYL